MGVKRLFLTLNFCIVDLLVFKNYLYLLGRLIIFNEGGAFAMAHLLIWIYLFYLPDFNLLLFSDLVFITSLFFRLL